MAYLITCQKIFFWFPGAQRHVATMNVIGFMLNGTVTPRLLPSLNKGMGFGKSGPRDHCWMQSLQEKPLFQNNHRQLSIYENPHCFSDLNLLLQTYHCATISRWLEAQVGPCFSGLFSWWLEASRQQLFMQSKQQTTEYNCP